MKGLLKCLVGFAALWGFASAADRLAVLSGSTDLTEMALGDCTSACSVWGTVGGVPVLGIKDANGNTVLKILDGFREGTPLPFSDLDAVFLEAVDTGNCVSDCARVLKLDGHWVFVYRDAAGGGVVSISPTSNKETEPSILLSEAPDCPTVTVEVIDCGCYLDDDNPTIMIMKYILKTTRVDCDGSVIDFEHEPQEVAYPASNGCLCKYLGES